MTVEEAAAKGGYFLLGCDPGTTSSALCLLAAGPEGVRLVSAAYRYNADMALRGPSEWGLGVLTDLGGPLFFVYEKLGMQCKVVGEEVFETAAVSGEIRRAVRPLVHGTYALRGSEWRHALTGQGNASDSATRYAVEHEFFAPTGGGRRDPYIGTEAEPGPLWAAGAAGKKREGDKNGNICHIIDSAGVALGLTLVRFRSGRDPEIYRRPW